MRNRWPTKDVAISSLQLDPRNPRLGRDPSTMSPRDIINHLFQHFKAIDIAESIARGGYFANEPLLAIREGSKFVVVEGNRRLAALKALIDPSLVDGPRSKRLGKLSKDMGGPEDITSVPVTIAPSRRETDKHVASRHIGTPVLQWEAENRAGFILAKLAENYTTAQLKAELGFTDADIQKARSAKAVADIARSLDLPGPIREKVNNPRAQLFSTIERVLVSAPGREFFRLEPNLEHGFRGNTSRESFVPAFARLLTDVALKKKTSRTLNSNEEIERYLADFPEGLKPKKQGSFTPDDFRGKSRGASTPSTDEAPRKRDKGVFKSVLPRSVKITFDHEKLSDIRDELVRLQRAKFPNAGAFLLRAFFEIAAVEFLRRTGELSAVVDELRGQHRLQGDAPTLKQMMGPLRKHAKQSLPSQLADSVEKAITYNKSAPFTISDLHSFVHQPHELPTERDILQFWKRIEPLMRLMLDTEATSGPKKTSGGKR